MAIMIATGESYDYLLLPSTYYLLPATYLLPHRQPSAAAELTQPEMIAQALARMTSQLELVTKTVAAGEKSRVY